MTDRTIRLETRGALAQLVLDRPDKRNALSASMWGTIPELVGATGADPAIKVLILRGARRRRSRPESTSPNSTGCTPRLREQIRERPVIGSWTALLDDLQVPLAHEPIEQFRVQFLDRKNVLIRDQVQQRGTVDHTPLYPREITRRALELQARR